MTNYPAPTVSGDSRHPHASAANCVPVRIRGTDYPSITAAAYALGIRPNTISGLLLRYGTADGAGLGYRSPRRNVTPHRQTPVTLFGRRFASIKEAADHLGFSYAWLYKALTKDKPADAMDRILAALIAAEKRRDAA